MGVAVIHVVDEHAATISSSSSSKEFRCDIKLLQAQMRLLRPTCAAVAPGQDIEITVKCDISTFAWLMAYVKAADSSNQQPEPDLSNCVQLLLASHYLQMPPVLRSCVAFIATSLLALAPIAAAQLCGLESCLLDKVAKAVQEEVLEALHQECQQQQHQPNSSSHVSIDASSSAAACALIEKLYKHKLRALLRQQNSTLLRCSACRQLYASASHHKLMCQAGHAPQTNRHSRLPLHEPDPSWTLQAFLAQCRAPSKPRHQQQQQLDLHLRPHLQQQGGQHAAQLQQLSPRREQQQAVQETQQQDKGDEDAPMSWRQLYWLLWGHVVVLYCQRCCGHFPARNLPQCSYHPLAPVFASEEALGQYPCCGAPAWHPCGSAVVAAAAASLQPCCSRDHDAYVPAQTAGSSSRAGGSVGQGVSQSGQAGRGQASPIAASRALQLLQLYGPLITSAGHAATPLQQQQQHGQGSVAMGAAEAAALPGAGPASMPELQQQQQQQPDADKATQHILPLLVRMVNREAAATAAAANSRSGNSSSGAGSRPSCVSPLPPISPRQQVPAAHPDSRQYSCVGRSSSKPHHIQRLGQQGEFDLPAAAAAAIGAAPAAGTRTGHHSRQRVDDSGSSSSDSGSSSGSESEDSLGDGRSSSSSSSGSDVSTGSGAHAAFPVGLHNSKHVIDFDSTDGFDKFSLTCVHSTPLSSMMGAVRAAAEARSRQGVGAFGSSGSSSAAGGGSAAAAAARLHQMGAPLAETFSPGGKMVLSAAGRKPQRPPSSNGSRPSTAASLLSLKQQQQQGLGRQSPSRPGTGSSAACTIAAAGAPPRSGSGGGSGAGGMSAAVCALNRTLLLELVQQDDAHRMAVLMRKLDSLRLQPPPDCGEQQQHPQGRQQQQQLTQFDVMQAVSRVVFPGV